MNTRFTEYAELFQNKAYRRYFSATSVSRIGTGIRFVSLTWLAMELTNSSYAVALTLVFESLPGILFSPVLGVYVDRLDKRIFSTCVNLFQALVLTALFFAMQAGVLMPWHLYLVIFCLALADILYRTLRVTIVRELVPEDKLLVANTASAMGDQLGTTLGAAVAGLVIAWFSTQAAVGVYIVCLLIGAFFFWRIRKGYVVAHTPSTKAKGWGAVLTELKAGYQYIGQHKEIIPIYGMMLVLISTLKTINVLLPPFASDVLKVGSSGFGYIDSSFAIGAIIGSFLLPKLRHRYPDHRLMSIGLYGLSASLMLFALSTSLWIAILGYFLIGITYQVWILNQTQAQESVEMSYQGRVHAAFTFFFSIASLLVYTVMGMLSEIVSQRWLYASQGVLVSLVWVVLYSLTSHRWKKQAVQNKQQSVNM
ncbi:MFS transporter [Brevibacillus dissolubilis]|uniref:MFS transporter n=1 Tax=Brevibacillus dissolubilis TaxID=1844116 RepID=UPI00159BE0F5|nr:MFS transporter [Brevibacillus dissolubilis]